MQDPDLWTRISGHRFDAPGTETTFAGKPMACEGWSAVSAHKAIAKYLRFVYLSQIGQGAITPTERMAGAAFIAAVGLVLGALHAGGAAGLYLALGAGASALAGFALLGVPKRDGGGD